MNRIDPSDGAVTVAGQDYLKRIFELSQWSGSVSTQELADALGVRCASVTNMVKRLHDLGLLVHTPYYGVCLTERGATIAADVLQRHHLLERYLSEVLGMPAERVHDEAERLEHHISEDLEQHIGHALGNLSENEPGH
jgi:DtxR family Mn-dependent transcriptional regulator